MTTKKTIGPKLKAEREKLGISGRSVARTIGVAQQTFSNWENGGREVPYEQLDPWGRALGLRIQLIIRPDDGAPEIDEESLSPAQRQVLKALLRALPTLDDQRAQVIAGVLDLAHERSKAGGA